MSTTTFTAFILPFATTDPEVFGIKEDRYLQIRAWVGTIVAIDVLSAQKTKAILFTPFSWLEKIYKKVEDTQELAFATFEVTMTFCNIIQRLADTPEGDEQFNNIMQQAWFIADHFKTRYGIEELDDSHAQTVKDFILEKMQADYATVKKMEQEQLNKPKEKSIISLDTQRSDGAGSAPQN